MDTQARARSAVTLAVLAVVFIIGVAWAWARVTEPFPEKAEQPPCTDSPVAAGEVLTPGDILVNVLNASSTEGLASDTMEALVRKGFVEGEKGNTSASTGEGGALIWTDDPSGPSARLLATYFGGHAEIVQQPTANPGITVVIGEDFPGVTDGHKRIKAASDTSICVPPPPAS
ncbi:LytR family transcriptional regulator [Nocardioides humilatus]|uniref:LytR family transcriptional regulator n=1 Tax=Nocardioides humilatus TaxID=2607660 RepID=A0A5B1LQ27_9ACTN|nr:LytR C-terminal domain-containing protein [Nocardioides humilatus]KAA1421707.1 LytR family transcriptional regulator [Nocardioides humilatus]